MAGNSAQRSKRPDPLPELVVAIPHLPLIRRYFADAGVLIHTSESFEPLGLARLELCNAEAAAESLRRFVQRAALNEPRLLERLTRYERAEPSDVVVTVASQADVDTRRHIETVLASVRALSSVEYDGWLPTVGKNRLVGWVVGGGEVSHGGSTDPQGGEVSHGDPQPTVRRADVEYPERVARSRRIPAWQPGPGRGARVGVLDTALWDNKWFSGRWVARQSDRLAVQDPSRHVLRAAAGHATFVTGLVLSQAPCATVEVRRVLDNDGFADSWTVAREIVDFGRSGLDVLNLSFMCYSEDSRPPMAIAAAIDRLDPDLVVVASAGNHARRRKDGSEPSLSRLPAWPAALDDVVAVGASGKNGRLAPFSPDARWVDLCVPGVDLVSTYLPAARVGAGKTRRYRKNQARWSGTSFAAALVSGAIAASIVPGRRPARAALDDLMRTVQRNGKHVGESGIPYLSLSVWD